MDQKSENTKPKFKSALGRSGRWWEVQFIDSQGKRQSETIRFALDAELRISELRREGLKCRLRRARYDFALVKPYENQVVIAQKRLTRNRVAELLDAYLTIDSSMGVFVFPSSTKITDYLPSSYEIFYPTATSESDEVQS